VSWRRYLLIGLPLSVLLVGLMAAMLALPDLGDVGRAVRQFVPALEHARERLYVRAIVEPPDDGNRIVILESEGGELVVPLFVDGRDGDAIRAARSGAPQSELLARTVGALGGQIAGAVIDSTPGHVNVKALVVVATPQGERTVDASPAESIVAALSAGKPIWATPEALADSGLTTEDLEKLLVAAKKLHEDEADRPAYSL
jgi:bifunctional DNase/RNase